MGLLAGLGWVVRVSLGVGVGLGLCSLCSCARGGFEPGGDTIVADRSIDISGLGDDDGPGEALADAPPCGNDHCDIEEGENCASCPLDCSGCPTIDGITFDQTISELATTRIDVSASDPADGNLSYEWKVLNGEGIKGSGPSAIFDPPDTGPHPCPYRVQVTATSLLSDLPTPAVVDITVKLAADINADGTANDADLDQLRADFGTEGDPGWIAADINSDGYVNFADLALLRAQFGQTGCAYP